MRVGPNSPPGAEPPQRTFLLPGSVYIASAPAIVTTILGSCIAVCLWDSRRKTGGMNHFVLPDHVNGCRNLRYGDAAIASLVAGLRDGGSRIGDLSAKVFGGATVLPYGTGQSTVGSRNLHIALDHLERYGIPVIGRRTGGAHGLLIRMDTFSGDVSIREVRSGLPDAPLSTANPVPRQSTIGRTHPSITRG